MIHPKLFLDNKNSTRGHAASTTLEEIRKRAKAEGKIGVLTLTGQRKHGHVYCIHSEDMIPFLRTLAEDLDFVQAAVCDETVLSEDTLYFGETLQSAKRKKMTVEKIGDAVTAAKTRVRVVVRCNKKREATAAAKRARSKKPKTVLVVGGNRR